jgi:hypothetical protein
MRRYLSVVILSLATVTLSQLGCASPQNDNNTAPTNANMAVPEATPDKAAITAELIKIENDWPRIIRERDGAAVKRVEADDVFLVYPDGQTGGKEQDIKDIESGALSADSWEITDLKVNLLDKDVAVVSLRNTVKNGKYKMADGKTNDISGQYRSVDTFVRRNGQWQLVASATVPVRAPAASASPTPKASPSPGASPAMKPTPALKGTPVAKPSPAAKASPATKKPASTPAKVAPKPAKTP